MAPYNATPSTAHVPIAEIPSRDATFITRVVIENYKSIVHCDVRLGPLTFLVGRNSSGKSNFLDALHFMSDALTQTLAGAVRVRENIAAIARLVNGMHQALGVRVEFMLPDGRAGSYGFEIAAHPFATPYALHREECRIWLPGDEHAVVYFRVRDGQVESNSGPMPAALPDHLYLVNASGIADFQDVYKALATMRFYQFDTGAIKRSASAGEEPVLAEDGSNLPGVLLKLANRHPDFMQRVREYLQMVVPDLEDVYAFEFGRQYALAFKERGEAGRLSFGAEQMADGTLRALAILLMLFQQVPGDERPVSLMALEEPETGLHRAAMGVLRDAFGDATETTQLLVTTHSTDLLDSKDVDAGWIRVVVSEHGATRIGPLSAATRSVVDDHLSTAGALLRSSPLYPALGSSTPAGSSLFDE